MIYKTIYYIQQVTAPGTRPGPGARSPAPWSPAPPKMDAPAHAIIYIYIMHSCARA